MSDIYIRKSGRAGRITLTRPKALNALTHEICNEISTALDSWKDVDDIDLLIIDAEGSKAFCAGGDIVELYETGTNGNFAYGHQFWKDEYRMNARLFEFPKPVVTFMQGYTLGGGVGLGGHGSHRIVGNSSKIAMPEVKIGLIPDVGGSHILANAPGRLGEYLGLTAAYMNAGDAIHAGFADYFIPEDLWAGLIQDLETTGDHTRIDAVALNPEPGPITRNQDQIDRTFAGEAFQDIVNALKFDTSEFARETLLRLSKHSPLAMACAVELIHRNRSAKSIRAVLEQEYRFVFRAAEHGDLLEGIRAAVIDKDGAPSWKHSTENLPTVEISKMLMPLGQDKLTF